MKPPFRADQVGSLLRPAGLAEARKQKDAAFQQAAIRADRREAGSDRPAGRHRRRVQPRLVAPRLPLAARRRRAAREPGAEVRRHRGAAADSDGHRQAALLEADHGRRFPLPEAGDDEDREVHDPFAVDAAPARRARRNIARRLPRHGRVLGRRGRRLPRGDRRVRQRRAAPTCSSTTSLSPICAIRRSATTAARTATTPMRCPRLYADTINAKRSKARPDGMTIAMHTCRGNFKSAWVAEGGYEPVAEAMFSTGVDAFFMEFDSARAGGFEPLRFVPKGKTGGARPGLVQDAGARSEGRAEEADRRGGEVRAARGPVPVAAVRLLEHPPRQPAHAGRAVEQARARGRGRRARYGAERFTGRREDHRLLTGQGRYTADWNLPGPALRRASCAPTARMRVITRINTCGGAVQRRGNGGLHRRGHEALQDAAAASEVSRPRRVHSRCPSDRSWRASACATSARRSRWSWRARRPRRRTRPRRSRSNIEDLPAVVDAAQALAAGAPLLHDDVPGNLAVRLRVRRREARRRGVGRRGARHAPDARVDARVGQRRWSRRRAWPPTTRRATATTSTPARRACR